MGKIIQLTLVKSDKTNMISTSEFVKDIIIMVQLKFLIGLTVMVGALWYAVLHTPGTCS